MPVNIPTLSVAPSTIVARLAAGDLLDQAPINVRSLMFDGVPLAAAVVASGDLVMIQDLDDSLILKAVTAQSIADLVLSALGDVVGPAGATDEALARYDTATGKLIQDSLILVDDAGAMTGMTTVDGRDLAVDGSKLDGIAPLATIDQTGAAIKSLYELEVLAFTDAQFSKLSGIEPLADITDEGNVIPALDGATITTATLAPTDKVLIQDVDDSDNLKTVTAQAIADLAGAASLLTEVLSTSGTTIDFSIPAGTTRITIIFNAVSVSGTSSLLIQLGDAGGFELTGYISTSTVNNGVGGGAVDSSIIGMVISTGNPANEFSGIMTLNLVNANDTWVSSHVGRMDPNFTDHGGGSKDLSAEITDVRITTVNGTDTFDNGSINVLLG